MEPDSTRAAVERVDTAEIARAVEVLRAGGLVAFPTETVYGLGADARNAAAARRIFDAKGRPPDNPLIAHVVDLDTAERLVAHPTALARLLARRWWPGPLTLVVPVREEVPREVTGGLDTVGIRSPAHPVARVMLQRSGLAIAAPSANRSGRPSPTTARHVADDLGETVDMILDGGPCSIGVESTVVDARGTVPVVLRDGALSRETLMADTGTDDREATADDDGLIRSPGTRYRHYAPDCEVRVLTAIDIAEAANKLIEAGARVGAVVPCDVSAGRADVITRFSSSDDLARRLFAALRRADERDCDVLLVARIDELGVGRAVMDRLRRAGDGHGT